MNNQIKIALFSFLSSLFILSQSIVHADLNLELPKQNTPNLINNPVPAFGFTKERKLGLKVLRKLRSRGNIIEDPEITNWIQSLGHRLSARASATGNPFYFLVSKNQSVNAFATMGGVVLVNAGLILKTDSESELAAVLSHEIAHVTQRHIERMIDQSKQNVLGRGAALLAGVVAGTQDPRLGQAIITTTMAASLHKQLSFSREAEAEADRIGISILANAGYNPQGMPQFLQKLEQLSDNRYAGITEYLQSHPLAHKRVVNAQFRAAKIGRRGGKEHVDYLYMREKVRALSNASAAAKVTPKIKQYAQVLRLKNRRNFTQALLKTKGYNRQVYEVALHAKLLNTQRQYQKTIQLIKPVLANYPSNIALTILLARATAALGKPEQAWNIIRTIPLKEQTSLEFFEVRQQIAHKARREAEAYRSVAERNIRIGEYKYATIQLRQAMKQRDINAAQLVSFQRILAEIENNKK